MYTLAIINPDYMRKNIGGAEVQTFLLARELVNRGWRVLYISEDIETHGVDEGIILIPFAPARNHDESVKRLAAQLRENSVQICYQRGRKLYSCYVHHAARLCGIPYVNAFSMDLDFKRYKFLFRDWNSARRIVRQLVRFPQLLRVDRCSRKAIQEADCVFFQSEYQKRKAKNILGVDGEIVRNMHPVPDDSTLVKEGGRCRVLWLATIKEWKRPEVFIRLARELRDENIEFVMAGNIRAQKYVGEIEAAQRELPNFSYVPCDSLDRSNELIATASIFVNTSRRAEGFPNTYIQAWLRGAIVVALEFNPDGLLTDGTLGRCSGSFEALKRDVVELAGDPGRRAAIARKARSHAIERYSVARNIDRVVTTLGRLVEERTRTGALVVPRGATG